jgi:hypothetical protein
MNWLQKNFKSLIYVAFLVPILTVAFVSISHVSTWYGLSNPVTWSIYLSIGIEIAALSALAAISAQMGRKVYFPFAIVTLIQFIGNIFFAYQYINIDSQSFKDWIDLVDPLVSFMGVESGDIIGHKRFLALFSGGMLPIISLSFLHMLVKFEEEDRKNKNTETPSLPENIDIEEISKMAGKMEAELEKEKYTPTKEELELLEQKLREINESKFKSLEVQEPVEDIVIEKETVEIPQVVDDSPEIITQEPEPIKETPKPKSSKINRLSYTNRNASNVSVQRI